MRRWSCSGVLPQLNPDVNVFQRKFVNEVRRCEEMDRKLSECLSLFFLLFLVFKSTFLPGFERKLYFAGYANASYVWSSRVFTSWCPSLSHRVRGERDQKGRYSHDGYGREPRGSFPQGHDRHGGDTSFSPEFCGLHWALADPSTSRSSRPRLRSWRTSWRRSTPTRRR